MRSAGRLCGRMMILEKVWDYGFDPGTNLVDVYIRRLREKILTRISSLNCSTRCGALVT